MTEPACGSGMFARRVAIMGADPANAVTADPAPPGWMTAEPAVQPYQPWSADVMILAGTGDDGGPWLWLACRGCGTFWGYSAQYAPAALAAAAAEHDAGCEVLAARRAEAGEDHSADDAEAGQ